MRMFMQNNLPVFALAPDADRFNGDPASDVYCLKYYDRITFLVIEGAGGTGTATITVEACDDSVPTTTAAIPFKYKTLTSADSSDAWSAVQAAPAAGITPAAGANKMTMIEVKANELGIGYSWCRLQLTEVADDPVDACVVAILSGPKSAQDLMPSALS